MAHTEDSGLSAEPTLQQLVPHLEALAESHRSLLARALHDEVGGSLVSAIMDLAWALALVPIGRRGRNGWFHFLRHP